MPSSSAIQTEQVPGSVWCRTQLDSLIIAPVSDLSLIVATPLLVWFGLSLAQQYWTGSQILSFAMVWAIGHHLPGMMRAYGDQALFQRFRWRFIFAPLVLVAVGVYSTLAQSAAIPLAVGFWGLWHYLMQSYGFLRIYDSKFRSVAPLTCRLDQAMCLVWFLGAAILTDNGLFSDLNLFYRAGGPLISPFVIESIQLVAQAALVVVTTLFIGNAIWRSYSGDPPSPVKLVLMATTFGFYWYCLATISNILVSYAMFELFHDAQYLTIVWSFNEKRAARDTGAGAFTRLLFRRRGGLIAVYLGLIALYGLSYNGTFALTSGTLQRALVGLFVGSTILHYYYDGFIWKLREADTRRTLGLSETTPARSTNWNHALSWCVAAVPLCGLGWLLVRENQQPTFGLEKHDALVATLPRSVFALHNRGQALAESGQLEAAEADYRRAIELNPYYPEVHFNLGTVLLRRGEKESAEKEFRLAVKQDPLHVAANYHLGMLLLEKERFREALPKLETAARLSPKRAEIQSALGSALVLANRHKEAIPHFQRALELNPDLVVVHGNLAQALAVAGDHAGALTQYRKAVELQPDSAIALFNLGMYLEQQQRYDEAVAAYRKSLKIDPQSHSVWNNLGGALAKQNQLDQAIKAFTRAVELKPDDVAATNNLQRAKSLLQEKPSQDKSL